MDGGRVLSGRTSREVIGERCSDGSAAAVSEASSAGAPGVVVDEIGV